MKLQPRYFPVAVCVAVLASPVSADIFEFTGHAKNSDGKTLYTEHHRVEGSCDNGIFQPIGHKVTYVHETEGSEKVFAGKKLDYSSSPVRPTVVYQQPDFRESLEITYTDSGSVAVVWQRPDGDTEGSGLKVSDNLVVDAGFDNLVRQNWDKVIGGEQVRFRFLAPTRGTDYAFVLEPAQSQIVDADHLVQIRPDSLVLKLLVDPIILGYNRRGALTAYSGLTNVRENKDKNHSATIFYAVSTYPVCGLVP